MVAKLHDPDFGTAKIRSVDATGPTPSEGGDREGRGKTKDKSVGRSWLTQDATVGDVEIHVSSVGFHYGDHISIADEEGNQVVGAGFGTIMLKHGLRDDYPE